MSAATPATVTPNARELAAMLRSARGLEENSQTLSMLMASPRLARAVLGLFLVGATIAGAHFSGGRTREVLRDSSGDLAIFHHNAARHPSLSPADGRVRSHTHQEENGMRSLRALVASTVGVGSMMAGGISGSALAQDAVQWRVEDGGNGHWYRLDPTIRLQPAARAVAEASGGHMATVTSAAEQAFVRALCSNCTWLGGEQSEGSCEPGCGWNWSTGEEWSFTAWRKGEPNNSVGEYFLALEGQTLDGGWNDAPPYAMCALMIEWSADCNADGIVDYGQIRAGDLEDTNANNIPDCCEAAEGCNPCLADIDESGAVNAVDLAAILSNWGTNGGKYPRADIDGNGDVDGADLAAVLSAWGPCP